MACHCSDPKAACNLVEQKIEKNYADKDGKVPPFLPQRSDFIAKPVVNNIQNGKTLGPWAAGRPIWSKTANLVGVRPIVDRYNINKYGAMDWRLGNKAVLDMVGESDTLKQFVKCTVDSVSAQADKAQNNNSLRLQQRLQDVRTYQNQIEALVMDLREEIVLLTEAKVKLKFALPSLKMPESIAGECIDKRTCRIEQDLVKDEVDVELVNEMAMIYEVRDSIEKMLEQVEELILTSKACKEELESNWSDKKETTDIEARNAALRNTSSTIFYKHGSVRLQNLQSNPETWTHYTETLIKMATQQVKKSRDFRNNLDTEVITKPIRDLRSQADKVMSLLKKRIEETDQCRQAFERELQNVLIQIADTESMYEILSKLLRQLDCSLKVAETRLDTRMFRPRVENCRDEPQYGLIDEVKELNESQSALKKRIEDTDQALAQLYQTRANLEFAIMTKRKSLYIDQQRCLAYREQYPDITTMTSAPA